MHRSARSTPARGRAGSRAFWFALGTGAGAGAGPATAGSPAFGGAATGLVGIINRAKPDISFAFCANRAGVTFKESLDYNPRAHGQCVGGLAARHRRSVRRLLPFAVHARQPLFESAHQTQQGAISEHVWKFLVFVVAHGGARLARAHARRLRLLCHRAGASAAAPSLVRSARAAAAPQAPTLVGGAGLSAIARGAARGYASGGAQMHASGRGMGFVVRVPLGLSYWASEAR